MIINKPIIKKENGYIIISSDIYIEKENKTHNLWFKLSDSYEEHITDHLDSFVLCSLFKAMKYGEDIEVKGKMSPKLAYGLKEFQRIFSFFTKELRKINIICEEYESITKIGKVVASTFSGGSDSFYNLYSHLPDKENIKELQITHALFINGFGEIHEGIYDIQKHYEQILKKN